MQKLRRVEIKEGEIRLVRHFKYEGTVVAAGGGRMRLVGPSGFDGGLRLPVVLTSPPPSSPLPLPPSLHRHPSPLGQARILHQHGRGSSSSERGRGGRR